MQYLEGFVNLQTHKKQQPDIKCMMWICGFAYFHCLICYLWVFYEFPLNQGWFFRILLPVIWALKRLFLIHMPPTASEPLGLRSITVYRSLWLSQQRADDTCVRALCAHTFKVMLIRFSSGCSTRDSHLHTMKSSEQKAVLRVTAGAAAHSVHWFTTKESSAFSKTVTLFFIPALHVCRLRRRTSHMEQMDES